MFNVTIDSKKTDVWLATISSQLRPKLASAVSKTAQQVKSNIDRNEPKITGLLRKSYLAKKRGEFNWVVSSILKYANQREFGGTIKPKGHPFLAFPINGKKEINFDKLFNELGYNAKVKKLYPKNGNASVKDAFEKAGAVLARSVKQKGNHVLERIVAPQAQRDLIINVDLAIKDLTK